MMTVSNLPLIGEDGSRFEVIQGELYVPSAPCLLHQFAVHRLASVLTVQLEASGLGHAIPGAVHSRDASGTMSLLRTFGITDDLESAIPPGFRLRLAELFDRPKWAER